MRARVLLVDAERLEQFRQFVGGMRPLTDQFVQIGGRNPQIACDAVELRRVELAHLVQLPPVLEPVAERMDQRFNDGIGLLWAVMGHLRIDLHNNEHESEVEASLR